MRGATNAQFDNVTTIVTRAPGDHYWLGGSRESAARVIEALPLELPKGKSYLFHLKGSSLLISESTTGVFAYRPSDLSKILSIEPRDDGTRVRVRDLPGIEEVVLVRTPVAVSSKALTLRSLSAPVELLDEYSNLRMKDSAGGLTEPERARREELIELIGTEFEKRARARVVSSSRSTPSSCGESRSGGYRSTGG